jgi:hypothetical protein
MGRWGDGEMGGWGDGEMGRWGNKGNFELLPYALCPMPYALCPMPYALCPELLVMLFLR